MTGVHIVSDMMHPATTGTHVMDEFDPFKVAAILKPKSYWSKPKLVSAPEKIIFRIV
jgi:hypothetical protein